MLVGLALYAVLAGADFGAGFWQLSAGRGERGERDPRARPHAMGPVWEANHVWLIFVLTVIWTAYPTAFGSIASTLSVPLFIAALGIIFRGAAYALRAGRPSPRESARDRHVFSRLLDPDAVRARRRGRRDRLRPRARRQRRGRPVSSWLNPTSIFIGVARRRQLRLPGRRLPRRRRGPAAASADLERAFRRRALGAGVVAGALALGGLVVLQHDDAPALSRAAHRRRARWR